MIVLFGAIIVFASVLGGFVMAGGHPLALMHLSELVIIGGAAIGALILMSPKKVLTDLIRQALGTLKGSPYSKSSYDDLFKALYELFMLGRRSGMIALEEHVMSPTTSSIFQKYPTFLKNQHAIEFLCSGLRPIIDGKIKPDQLKLLLEIELDAMEEEDERPVGVLTKAADAMPGFGIVAAVLGIVITMASIAGPIEEIGEKVAAALVGTFLGILLCYGFLGPMAANLKKQSDAESEYLSSLRMGLLAYMKGMSPILALEAARRAIPPHVRPTFKQMDDACRKSPAVPAAEVAA